MQAGDLIFCRGRGAIARAIRVGEWLRGHRGRWNHVAVISAVGPKGIEVIQAEGHGVTRRVNWSIEDVAPGGEVEVVTPKCDQVAQVAFLRSQVGRTYGFVTIASICISIVVPWFLTVRIRNTWICSAVSAESLRVGGWFHDWPDIYQVTPQQLYDALQNC
jgi:hypothetical protein